MPGLEQEHLDRIDRLREQRETPAPSVVEAVHPWIRYEVRPHAKFEAVCCGCRAVIGSEEPLLICMACGAAYRVEWGIAQ
jgi:hypothetical protein